MTNLAMKLDTLAYSKRLIAAGCEPKLAEAHASLQQESLVEISEDYLSQFVTKQEFNAKMDMIDHRFETLEQKIETMSMKITLKLGALMTAGVLILAALIKLH